MILSKKRKKYKNYGILKKTTMKKGIVLFIMLIFVQKINSQNLVMNPGLDTYITCPGFGQFSSAYIFSWDKPTIASSDYYNFNCPGIQPTVQPCYSGEGYAGIICYNFGTEYREYITGTFSSPLVAGTVYDVEFYVSLHNGYIQAIEEIGAYISVTAPGPFSNSLHINAIPQIENTSGALADTLNWKQISGQFTAAGGEQFITIGNFYDDAGTTITQPGSSGSYGAYYFIDEVSVSEVPSTALNNIDDQPVITLLNNTIIDINIPDHIQLNNNFILDAYDFSGKCVMSKPVFSGNRIDLSGFEAGLYFLRLTNKNEINVSAKIFLAGN